MLANSRDDHCSLCGGEKARPCKRVLIGEDDVRKYEGECGDGTRPNALDLEESMAHGGPGPKSEYNILPGTRARTTPSSQPRCPSRRLPCPPHPSPEFPQAAPGDMRASLADSQPRVPPGRANWRAGMDAPPREGPIGLGSAPFSPRPCARPRSSPPSALPSSRSSSSTPSHMPT